LIVAKRSILQLDISTVSVLDVIIPSLPETLLSSRLPDVLLFGLWAREQINSFGLSKRLNPCRRETADFRERLYKLEATRKLLLFEWFA
jgi:hypothetical protein